MQDFATWLARARKSFIAGMFLSRLQECNFSTVFFFSLENLEKIKRKKEPSGLEVGESQRKKKGWRRKIVKSKKKFDGSHLRPTELLTEAICRHSLVSNPCSLIHSTQFKSNFISNERSIDAR